MNKSDMKRVERDTKLGYVFRIQGEKHLWIRFCPYTSVNQEREWIIIDEL